MRSITATSLSASRLSATYRAGLQRWLPVPGAQDITKWMLAPTVPAMWVLGLYCHPACGGWAVTHPESYASSMEQCPLMGKLPARDLPVSCPRPNARWPALSTMTATLLP